MTEPFPFNRPPLKPFKINSIFPSPLYIAQRETPLSPEEKIYIDNIETQDTPHPENRHKTGISLESYILNDNESLAILKEFCELHVKIYVNQIIMPKYDLDFYITQSWINKTKPHESHNYHDHPNSIISGIFCVHSVKNDCIGFHDPYYTFKNPIDIQEKEHNPWNHDIWNFPVNDNDLFLFPSWLEHSVSTNPEATTDRISLAFNVHAKGRFGEADRKNELFI